MTSLHDAKYRDVIDKLVEIRNELGFTQSYLASVVGVAQAQIAKIETYEARIDIVQLLDLLQGLQYSPKKFFTEIGWIPADSVKIAVPVKGGIIPDGDGIILSLTQDQEIYQIKLDNVDEQSFIDVEDKVTELFRNLNSRSKTKNRDTIADALEFAISKLPHANPSDVYHHIIYRLYLREYNRTKAEQSWVRAGGEGVELFLVRRYSKFLNARQIYIVPLLNDELRNEALTEMGIKSLVGDSKLDLALYGTHKGRRVIFGGIHSKSSLAERVSDDVPCSEHMMKKGFTSILFTFDAKSFPPPTGDLKNYGELGTIAEPSDKRKYIEEHGSFDACFSYNLRSVPSGAHTTSVLTI